MSTMRYSRHKKRQDNLIVAVALFAVLIGAGASGQQIANNTALLLPILLGFGFLVVIATVYIVLRREQRRQQAQRALDIADVDSMEGEVFERYIGDILKSQGYHIRYTPRTGDGGIDLLATKDRVVYAIQAKRYTGSVSNHAVMEAFSGMAHYKAHKAAVITTSHFTPAAKAQALSNNVKLIDREVLGEWILIFQSDTPGHTAKISLK